MMLYFRQPIFVIIWEKLAVSKRYRKQAAILKESIEAYFEQQWKALIPMHILKETMCSARGCIPLTVGINERADLIKNPIFAAFVDREWIVTQAGSNTQDRSTLYALRGVYGRGY